MRAPFVFWAKASGLPLLACAATFINPLAAFAVGDAPGSVSFVDRAALAANGWGGSTANPLRAPSDSVQAQYRPNALRNSAQPGDDAVIVDETSQPAEEVVPASYDSPRDPNGLQLRPYSQPTGIFSGLSSDPRSAASPNGYVPKPKPKMPNNAAASQMPPATQAGAERSKGLIPQFLSFTPKPKAKTIPPTYGSPVTGQGTATAGLSPTSRAGSVAQSSPYGAISRSQNQMAAQNMGNPGMTSSALANQNQLSYANAAAAESYGRPGMSQYGPNAGAPTAQRRSPQLASIPTAAAPTAAYASAAAATNSTPRAIAPRQPVETASYRPTPAQPDADNSPAAQMLVQAHAIADRSTSEDDFSQVCAACQRVMASQPTSAEAGFAKQLSAWALNRRGQIKASAGRADDALADFTAAIELDPHLWRAIHNRGVLMAQAGQFDKAFDDFNRTTELNPQFAKAFSNRASLYMVAGQPEPALHDYERACELDPTLEVAQRGCGRTCHMLGRLDEADQHLNKALDLAPNDASALTSRGDLLTDIGDYVNAAADYERALQLDGKSTDACRGSAWLLATCPDSSIRNPEVALHRAELAAKLEHKPDPTTFDTLAAAQASAGDFAAATQTIRRAIELAPPSERSVYQDRLAMYRQSTPFQIAPIPDVRQAGYQQH
jgi:tetratricopeptide (TPR) repeat protein